MSESVINTALVEPGLELSSRSQLLGSSIGSLSSASRRETSPISKAYKNASNLFLTRRLSEALSILEPIIVKPLDLTSSDEYEEAPIAGVSRSSRIKVLSLYLTLVNAIIELGPEDGKAAFGNKAWRDIVSKARDGGIWEEVVQVGYNGIEGNVDAEVVINLATILLSQSSSQVINQQRMESYLSASNQPTTDIREPSGTSNNVNGRKGYGNSTGSPRDLASHIKLLELYSLHILPRNDEWEYAREFIGINKMLDEENRAAFLQALQTLEQFKSQDHETEERVAQEQEDRSKGERQEIEKEILRQVHAKDERLAYEQELNGHKRVESEKDYGIDVPNPAPISGKTGTISSKPIAKVTKDKNRQFLQIPSTTSLNNSKKLGLYSHSLAITNALQRLVLNIVYSLSKNPMPLLRFVFFVMGLVVALSRRGVKDKIGRITGVGWDKVRRTVGMGVKVSYI